MDPRVLWFRDGFVPLPDSFVDQEPKNMMYAAGDGYGGFIKSNNNMKKTNIEIFSKLGYTIFCCVEDNSHGFDDNIQYLLDNPNLNVILCVLTDDNKIDYPILEALFSDSLDLIDTDDKRVYPSAELAFSMLKAGGICKNIRRTHLINDNYWQAPNFKIIDIDGYTLTLKKNRKRFSTNIDEDEFDDQYVTLMLNDTKPHIERRRNILRRIYEEKETRRNSWKRWRNKPSRGGYTRKRSNRLVSGPRM